MSKIMGTVRNGKIEPDEPMDWPDGHRVIIGDAEADFDFMRNGEPEFEFLPDDWPDTPENRAELLRRIDAFQPLGLTAEEEARIEAAREEFKRVEIEAVRRQMGFEE